MSKPSQTILTIVLELEMVVHHHPVRMDRIHNLTVAEQLRKGLSVSFANPTNPSQHPLDPLRPPYKAPITHVVAAQPMLVIADPNCATPVVDWIGDHPNPRHFLVTSRNGLHRGITDSMDMFSAGVVVETPVLRVGSWRFTTEGLLRSLSAAEKIRIDFTPYCGLHVHIGRRGGFELKHIKGLAKAVVIFEEEIENAFHPEHKRGGGIETRVNVESNRSISESLKTLETTLEMVRLIEAQGTVSDVRTVICDEDVGHGEFKYNFQSLVEAGSVEFRQAQGTLDERWVTEWVEMLILFVKAAEVVSEDLFEEFAQAIDRGENVLEDFLAWGGYVCKKYKGTSEKGEGSEEEDGHDSDTGSGDGGVESSTGDAYDPGEETVATTRKEFILLITEFEGTTTPL